MIQPTHTFAYWETNRIVLQFRLPGRDVYADMAWPPASSTNGGPRVALAALRFEAQGREHLPRSHALPVQSPEAWRQVNERLLQEIVPAGVHVGVLVVAQGQETVVFRDETGHIERRKLEDKPTEVQLVGTLDDAAFADRTHAAAQAFLRGEGQSVRWAAFATGQDPAFVILDFERRLTAIISHPVDPELQPSVLGGAFPLRALHALILRGTVVSAIKNPITTLSRALFRVRNAGLAIMPTIVGKADAVPVPVSGAPGMDLTAWEARLDQILPPHRYMGSIRFLIDGERFFPVLLQAIQTAERQIDFEVYIFDNDDYAVRIADYLRARSRSVKVRVLMDELASLTSGISPPGSPLPVGFVPPRDMEGYLQRHSRVRARKMTNPWLTMNHRKLMVFDGSKAFLGGMNIGREYRYEWHDLMVELEGPIAARLQREFELDWAHAGLLGDAAYLWRTLFPETESVRTPPGAIPIRILSTQMAHAEIFRAQVEAIRRTQGYIYLENPYLADDVILRELIHARRRGVDVRVVLPIDNDSGIMSASNLVTANAMIREGIRVYLYPGMTHVKAAIYDGWACLGSANYDRLSLRDHQELNIGFSDPSAVATLKRDLFETDFARSTELVQPASVRWTDYLIESLANLF